MAMFFTSDTHFGHKNIIEYCGRPYNSVEKMNEDIIKKWNEIVQKGDIVYHLGDFSFKGFKRYWDRLNGTIVLIKGNHDEDSWTALKEAVVKFGGKDWGMTHVPPEVQRQDFCLCGHVHEKWKHQKKGNKIVINVGVDVWDFKPVSIKQILRYCEKIKKE